ncbi:hypothetical protein C0Q70_21173 [Pomacea canaliculata]|uniref:Uncharacterized protein n=1 Tax=Pomacea canaliculata TaxID=400727 RepID=A0A2T7NBT2_POMCA|nr:uncharacterized protein LOC112555130 [Pomacea canaliculata]PVD18623.1 hypothetical protein C0Q70_21173 [Pomacea canaliculata]
MKNGDRTRYKGARGKFSCPCKNAENFGFQWCAAAKQPKDSEASYELWKFEVNCVKPDAAYDRHAVLEAVRRSLRGEAARVAMRLGVNATADSIISKFDSLYGTVRGGEDLLADVYAAKQQDGEDVATWSCRLEDLWAKAAEVLRCRFWKGLVQPLRDRSGHKFTTINDFDELRRIMRQFEWTSDHQPRKPTATTKAAQSVDEVTALKAQLYQLQREMAEMIGRQPDDDPAKGRRGTQRRSKQPHPPQPARTR